MEYKPQKPLHYTEDTKVLKAEHIEAFGNDAHSLVTYIIIERFEVNDKIDTPTGRPPHT